MRARIVTTLTTFAATVAAVAPGAQAKSYRISTENGLVVRMGPLKVRHSAHLRHAIAAFGDSTAIRRTEAACNVRWSPLKLDATFTSFAGITDYCGRGALQRAVVRSPMWRTWAGLRVRMQSSRVPELHRKAQFVDGKWVLATQDIVGPEPSPTVSALVRDGRVIAITLWVGAAGD